jgi:hypothetical protein
MIIHYRCDGKPIGETIFIYIPEVYADWFRSIAEAVGMPRRPKSSSNNILIRSPIWILDGRSMRCKYPRADAHRENYFAPLI